MMLTLVLTAAIAQAPTGAKVYEDNCAQCHSAAQQDPRTPALGVRRRRTVDEIRGALTTGKMREQGSSLSEAERRAVATYLGTASSALSGSFAGMCTAAPAFDPSKGPSWMAWSPDASNTRFQPQPGISAERVPKLTRNGALGCPNAGVATGQPTIAGGRVFVGSQSGTVYALDAKTGCIVWAFKAQSRVRAGVVIAPRAGAPGKYVAYVGDGRSNVYALD